MIGCDDVKHGTLATISDISPLAFVLSECIALEAMDASETSIDCHMLELLVNPTNGESLLGRTFSVELNALFLVHSSLDDLNNSFSRSSSLQNMNVN